MGIFFKMFPNLSQNWFKLRKFWKNRPICSKLSPKSADWYINWSLFLEKLVFVWVYFQILRPYQTPKLNLSTPPSPGITILWKWEAIWWNFNIQKCSIKNSLCTWWQIWLYLTTAHHNSLSHSFRNCPEFVYYMYSLNCICFNIFGKNHTYHFCC